MNELLTEGKAEVILYGDNQAAISMTTGSGGSSWRTRHLRIRAASLRQCLEQDDWILRHLKGTELVADGFTKGLLHQSWERFLQDLGLEVRRREETLNVEDYKIQETAQVQRTGEKEIKEQLAMKAMAVGGLLIATSSTTSDEEKAWVGAQLMALGWKSLQDQKAREADSTSGECLEEIMEMKEAPVLKVRRERSRSRDDRGDPRGGEGPRRRRESSRSTSRASSPPRPLSDLGVLIGQLSELGRRLQQPPPGAHPGEGGASSSGVDRPGTGATTGGLSSDGRSRRNQEFAELTSDTNMAAMHDAVGEDGEDDLNEILERENDIEEILRLERPPEENRRRLAEVGRATAREGLRRMGAAMRAEAEAAGDEDVDQENTEDQQQEGSHQETPLEELLDDVVESLGGEPQTFVVIRNPARRVILTYLLRNPRETPRSQEELDELVRSLGQPSTHTMS